MRGVLRRHPWVTAHVAWAVTWLALDLSWGGLLAAGFSTAGLQQAYMFLLYPLGFAVLLLLWASARATALVRRHFHPSKR